MSISLAKNGERTLERSSNSGEGPQTLKRSLDLLRRKTLAHFEALKADSVTKSQEMKEKVSVEDFKEQNRGLFQENNTDQKGP